MESFSSPSKCAVIFCIPLLRLLAHFYSHSMAKLPALCVLLSPIPLHPLLHFLLLSPSLLLKPLWTGADGFHVAAHSEQFKAFFSSSFQQCLPYLICKSMKNQKDFLCFLLLLSCCISVSFEDSSASLPTSQHWSMPGFWVWFPSLSAWIPLLTSGTPLNDTPILRTPKCLSSVQNSPLNHRCIFPSIFTLERLRGTYSAACAKQNHCLFTWAHTHTHICTHRHRHMHAYTSFPCFGVFYHLSSFSDHNSWSHLWLLFFSHSLSNPPGSWFGSIFKIYSESDFTNSIGWSQPP